MFQFVPPALLPKLTDLSPYTLLVFRKGINFHQENTMEIIQSKHLPYLFELREKGLVLLSFPVIDDADVRAIAIYNTQSKQEVEEYVSRDPAVQAGIFTYEILSGLGLKGDILV